MKLQVTIQSIRAARPNGWAIYGSDQGTCLGVIPFQVCLGNRLELEGGWETSSYNGQRQFRFTSVVPHIVHEPRALLTYACELTKGLGPARAEQIWELYGETWQSDDELLWVAGLSAATRSAWKETLVRLQEQTAQSETMAFLIGHACTMKLALAAWVAWQVGTVARVTANCYELASLPHYGFLDVDGDIRRSFGIGDEDPRRLEAATLYTLNQMAARGDTAVELQGLIKAVIGLVPKSGDEVLAAIKALQERCALRWLDGYVAREADYQAETAIGRAFNIL